MSDNKHKIGDKVKICSLEWYNQNKDELGCVDGFTPEMTKYCGSVATITEEYFGVYSLDIDNGEWRWNDEMFEEN